MSGKLKYDGKARIARVNTRKELVDGERELTCAVAIRLSNVPVEVVDNLDDMLGEFLFDSGGIVRNPLIGPITICARMGGYTIIVAGVECIGASVNKITLWPSDGNRFTVDLLVSFGPDGAGFYAIAESIAEEVDFKLIPTNRELF